MIDVYPKMSEVVKEAADVVLLQPATENPGLQTDLSKEAAMSPVAASGSQVQIQMRQPFKFAHLLHAPRLHFWHILAHWHLFGTYLRDDVASGMKNVPDAYISRCRLGKHGKHGQPAQPAQPAQPTGPTIRQLHRPSAKNGGSGSCWLLTTS